VEYVSPYHVDALRRKGFDVPNRLTKAVYQQLMTEYERKCKITELRSAGKSIAPDASYADVDRLWRILRLQQKGVNVLDSESLQHVEEIDAKREAIRFFHAKVVGVCSLNADGASRQDVIARCQPREVLKLSHEKDNAYDRNAVAVLRSNGEQLGHLNADLAEEVSARLDDGWQYTTIIKAIRSDETASNIRGVVLILIVAKPGISKEEIQAFTTEFVIPALEEK